MSRNVVNPPKQAQEQLKALFVQVQQAQAMFEKFAEGVMMGLGLEGDWRLEIATMTFRKVEKEEKKDD
jgi:hypothetical protein